MKESDAFSLGKIKSQCQSSSKITESEMIKAAIGNLQTASKHWKPGKLPKKASAGTPILKNSPQ